MSRIQEYFPNFAVFQTWLVHGSLKLGSKDRIGRAAQDGSAEVG